jgi:hypothetical protein
MSRHTVRDVMYKKNQNNLSNLERKEYLKETPLLAGGSEGLFG